MVFPNGSSSVFKENRAAGQVRDEMRCEESWDLATPLRGKGTVKVFGAWFERGSVNTEDRDNF